MAERYEFIRKVAQGGFGRVYVARDTRLGREVAIKRLLTADESAGQEQAEAIFQREATTLAAMQHPNIVQIFDFDRDDEGTYVVMEMLEGETLKERLDRGPLSWDTFVSVAKQGLDAINAAHSKGILHRDLKPENLFLHKTPSGTRVLKILDFGLAKLSQAPSKQTMDQAGNVFGSIYYMAPEQFMREPLDGRTDLYALGCVFYQALTQRFPFRGENMQGTMEAHMKHQVKHLRERRPDIDGIVADWVMRLISFKPADRPASAIDAIKEFDAALSGKTPAPVAAPAPAPQPQVISSVSSKPVAPMPQPVRSGPPTSGGRITGSTSDASGMMKTPMQTRAVSALEVSRAEARAKLEATAKRNRLIVMIGAPVAAVAAVAFVFMRPAGGAGSKSAVAAGSAGKTSSSTSSTTAAPSVTPAALLTLPMEEFLTWRFRAGVEGQHKGKDGKQKESTPHLNQKVHVLKNIAPKVQRSWLTPFENKPDRAGEQKETEVKGPGTKHPYLFFPTSTGMETRLGGTEMGQAPGGPASDPLGVTIAGFFRANGGSKERSLRPLLLTTTKAGVESFSLHFSHRVGQFWVSAQRSGQQAQATVTPEQFAKSGAGGNWVAAVGVWDAKEGILSLAVRSPDGKTARSSTQAKLPAGMPVLDRLNVGLFYPPKDSKLDPKEKMDGDIIELAVYRQALDLATQDKLLNALWDRYFNKR